MAEYYTIIGGKKLQGEIRLAGAKNVATKVIISSLLADSKSVFENIPRINDVEITLEICHALGAEYKWLDKNTLEIDPVPLKKHKVPLEYSGKNRVPILFFGPLLHKFNKAEVPVLGGCSIGARSVDFHVEAYKKLGAEIQFEDNRYLIQTDGLKGTTIKLNYPSVGATENIILGASLAHGTTVLKNAAIEPEIEDLALFLQSMGAVIYQDVGRVWIIEGVKKLRGAHFKIMDDRIEAASFASLAVANDSDIFIRGANQRFLITFLNWIRKLGASFETYNDGIKFMGGHKLKGVVLETDVHPGFMTDWQQPFSIALTQAEGVSIIHETVYENRLGYVDALNKMGAKIYVFSECLGNKSCRFVHRDFAHSAIIVGPTPLHGEKIEIPDLRAGFSYLIAALIAEGRSEIFGIDKIERGYENLKERLINLGADIK